MKRTVAELTAAIRAEIRWHQDEAERHQNAAVEIVAEDREASVERLMHMVNASAHLTAATRLEAILR